MDLECQPPEHPAELSIWPSLWGLPPGVRLATRLDVSCGLRNLPRKGQAALHDLAYPKAP